MSLDLVRSAVWDIVDRLACEDYEGAIGRCVTSRLTSNDLRVAIRDYGRKLMSPPANAYDQLDAVSVKGTVVPTWSVRAPLWTEEEGRSDLMLELTTSLQASVIRIELDDLRVP